MHLLQVKVQRNILQTGITRSCACDGMLSPADRWATRCMLTKEQYSVRVMLCHHHQEVYRVVERQGTSSLAPRKQRIDRRWHWWVWVAGVLVITKDVGSG